MTDTRSRFRSIATGGACILFASLVVRADSPPPIPPGQINAVSDGWDQSRRAHVSATGEIAASDAQARSQLSTMNAKLAPLQFDSSGLRVSAEGHVTVEGTVAVANMPAMQSVTGTVTVANMPSVQPVSGTVEIANLPETQNVNVVNGGMAATTGRFGSWGFHLVNDGIALKDWLNHTTASTRFAHVLFGQSKLVTLITLNSNHDVHLICRSQGYVLFVLANSSGNQRQEFVHPLQVDDCILACVQSQPNSIGEVGPQVCEGIVTIAGIGPSAGETGLPLWDTTATASGQVGTGVPCPNGALGGFGCF